MITYTNEDCMVGMARYPDKHFDLAIVDPPYGIKDLIVNGGEKGRRLNVAKGLAKFDFVPPKEYFEELYRVSKNQIIWGGNYFVEHLTHSRGWIVWDKNFPPNFTFAKAELAYTSFNTNLEMFRLSAWLEKHDYHPTQKPVALYKWLLKNYAKQGDLILDTHVGSASSLIACHDMGFDAVGFELDADYYKASKQRLEEFMRQPKIEELFVEQSEQMVIGGD